MQFTSDNDSYQDVASEISTAIGAHNILFIAGSLSLKEAGNEASLSEVAGSFESITIASGNVVKYFENKHRLLNGVEDSRERHKHNYAVSSEASAQYLVREGLATVQRIRNAGHFVYKDREAEFYSYTLAFLAGAHRMDTTSKIVG